MISFDVYNNHGGFQIPEDFMGFEDFRSAKTHMTTKVFKNMKR